jgi:hypothetical protein
MSRVKNQKDALFVQVARASTSSFGLVWSADLIDLGMQENMRFTTQSAPRFENCNWSPSLPCIAKELLTCLIRLAASGLELWGATRSVLVALHDDKSRLAICMKIQQNVVLPQLSAVVCLAPFTWKR